MSVLNDPKLDALLETLHAQSKAQEPETWAHFSEAWHAKKPVDLASGEDKRFMAGKLVALEADKAEFCYLMARALGARNIVEAGTSHGISTLYLAAALRDNTKSGSKTGKVIATEYEPEKAKAARTNFRKAGLSDFIELREGDLRETLKLISAEIDFVLIDIWIPMALPALSLVAPQMRKGAVAICDNTKQFREEYRDYFAFLAEPKNGFRATTLPFDGGLEFSVKCG
jgi:predicted O-methyltransferase YrrM